MSKTFMHSPEIASIKGVGINGAVLFSYISYWLRKNHARSMNQHDGRTWMFDTHEQIASWLEWSHDKVRRNIKKLKAANLLVTGRYNRRKADRTTWYAFANQDRFLPSKTTQDSDSITGSNSACCKRESASASRESASALPEKRQRNASDNINDLGDTPCSLLSPDRSLCDQIALSPYYCKLNAEERALHNTITHFKPAVGDRVTSKTFTAWVKIQNYSLAEIEGAFNFYKIQARCADAKNPISNMGGYIVNCIRKGLFALDPIAEEMKAAAKRAKEFPDPRPVAEERHYPLTEEQLQQEFVHKDELSTEVIDARKQAAVALQNQYGIYFVSAGPTTVTVRLMDEIVKGKPVANVYTRAYDWDNYDVFLNSCDAFIECSLRNANCA